MTTHDSEFLRALRNFPAPPSGFLEKAKRIMRVERFQKGAHLIRAGDTSPTFGVVMQGVMRKFYLGSKHQEHVKGFAREGQCVGSYASLLTKSAAHYNIDAVEESLVWVGDYGKLSTEFASDPYWLELRTFVAEQTAMELEKREAQLLMFSAAERYETFIKEFPDLYQRLPQYQIASYLGITPVALSRLNRQRVGR